MDENTSRTVFEMDLKNLTKTELETSFPPKEVVDLSPGKEEV